MSECEDCKRAVRQEGEGAMCFNCHLAKSAPLPTAQEIESDGYSTDQVARMHKRIAELEGIISEALGNMEYHSPSLGEYWLVTNRDIQSLRAALQEQGE